MKQVPQFFTRNSTVTLAVLLCYIVLAGVMLFPLSIQLANHVPDWGDPLEYAWALAWGGRALIENPLALYNANIFYPYPNALAFSESQVASAVLALPILLATYNPILAYNFVFLFAFVFSGFNAYLLAYDLTRSRAGALLAGFAFAFWAYKFNHLSHLNLVTLEWLPLVLFALRRALTQDKIVFPILFAVTFTLQALSSWYAALMTMLVVALYVIYVFIAQRGKWNTRRWLNLALCFAIALVPIVLIALPYFQVSREMQFARALSEAERFSARPLSFVSVAPFNWLYKNILPRALGDALFPGALLFILAAFGLRKKYPFPDRAFWIFAILFFSILAFGPIFQISPLPEIPSPLYAFLYNFLPGFQGTRAPARFFVVGMLGLTLLTANGFASLTRNFSPRARVITTFAALVLMCAETFSFPIPLVPIETSAQVPAAYAWLKQQPEGNVLEVPVHVGDIEPITRAMYFSAYHQRAMPLGYASFIPPTQTDFLHTLNTALETPSPRAPNMLREFDVRYVILNRRGEHAAFYENAFAQLPTFQVAYEDATQRVYSINTNAPAHPLQLGCLAPTFAAPNAPYIAYLTIHHDRRYPIVNDDLQSHTLKLEWRAQNGTTSTQTQNVRLPYVLRERVEGVPLQITAPTQTGTYDLICTLDAQPALTVQRVVVTPTVQTQTASPNLELVAQSSAPTQPERGGEVITTFFWRRRAEIQENVEMRVQLVSEDASVIAEITREPILYAYPVRLWRDNELVADAYALPISADAPSGNYRVVIQTLINGEPAPFRAPSGEITTSFQSERIFVK